MCHLPLKHRLFFFCQRLPWLDNLQQQFVFFTTKKNMFLLSLQHNIIDYCLGLSRVRRLTLCSCRKSYRRHSHTSSQSSGSVFGQGLLKPFFQETQKWQLIWKLKVAHFQAFFWHKTQKWLSILELLQLLLWLNVATTLDKLLSILLTDWHAQWGIWL